MLAKPETWRLGARTLLHLGDEILVEETSRLLVQRAVDCDNVALGQHLFKIIHSSTANLFLDLRLQRLVVKVEQLFAVEGLQSAKYTLTDAAHSNSTDNLALKIVLVLGNGSDVPVTAFDLFVCRNEVSDEKEDSHHDMLGHRHDIGSGNLCNSDPTVGLVCSIQINMVRTNTSSHCNLQVLGLCQALGGQIAGMEAVWSVSGSSSIGVDLRGGDDDFSINQFLIEFGALAFLVRGSHKSMPLILEPFSNTQLVLGSTQELGLFFGMLMALDSALALPTSKRSTRVSYIVEDEKNFSLSRRSSC